MGALVSQFPSPGSVKCLLSAAEKSRLSSLCCPPAKWRRPIHLTPQYGTEVDAARLQANKGARLRAESVRFLVVAATSRAYHSSWMMRKTGSW